MSGPSGLHDLLCHATVLWPTSTWEVPPSAVAVWDIFLDGLPIDAVWATLLDLSCDPVDGKAMPGPRELRAAVLERIDPL